MVYGIFFCIQTWRTVDGLQRTKRPREGFHAQPNFIPDSIPESSKSYKSLTVA